MIFSQIGNLTTHRKGGRRIMDTFFTNQSSANNINFFGGKKAALTICDDNINTRQQEGS